MLAFTRMRALMIETSTLRARGRPPSGVLRYAGLCLVLCAALAGSLSPAQDNVASLAEQAEALEEQGRLDAAAATYRRILELDPQSVAALNRLGALCVKQQQFQAGIDYYQRALTLNPREFATNLNLGIAYVKVANYRSARYPLEIAAEDAPDDFQARELLGVAMIGQEDYPGAIPQLEAALRLNPSDVGTMYLLDRAYLECEQYPKALSTFKRIEELDPGSPWLHVLQGQAYDGIGNYSQSIAEFEAARQQLPKDATVRFSLGFMYWKVRRYPDAEAELEQAVTLDSQFEQAKYYLADACLMNQQPEKALPILEALIKEQPQNARALADLGKAFERLNRSTDAAHCYLEALKIDPHQPEAHYRLAQIYQKAGRLAESQREFALAEKLQQDKRQQEETLLKASGPRGNSGPGGRLTPGVN
jgi:tetratricopeptide (TPR) repeat protein